MAAGDCSASEPGYMVELLCDYLDLILVPATLRRPSLREDAIRCPCGRCLGAAQALQQLQHSTTMRALLQASALPFLCEAVEHAAGLADSSDEIAGDGERAAECLAVFAACAKLQDGVQFDVPSRALHAVLSLLRSVSISSPSPSSSTFFSGWPRQTLLGAAHVLRNVAGNQAEVLETSTDALAAYGRHLWAGIEGLAVEAFQAEPRRPRRRPTAVNERGAGASAAVLTGDEDALNGRSAGSAAATAPGDSPEPPPPRPAAEPVATGRGAAGVGEPVFDTGNPQESDECTSGAEVTALAEAREPKQPTVMNEEAVEVQNSRPRSASEDSSSPPAAAAEALASAELRLRCAEVMALFSLVLQALYQTDEGLRQPGVFTSEDAVRWQLVALAQPLRAAAPPLPAKWCERLAFHGLRLYLLISRSSHTRRQYVVPQRPFVDSEKRMVAFLLSLTPPSQRCCVLLRAMAHDVNSWLLWQAQAAPAASSTRPTRPPAPHASAPAARPRRRRLAQESGTSGSAAVASTSKARHRSPKQPASGAGSELARKTRSASGEGAPSPKQESGSPGPEVADLARLFSAESGEAVWLVHAVLLLAFVLCLLAVWHSLEHPRGPGLGNTWRFEF